MEDRVTWLIPVLNGMPYLPETLASIEAQTYKNWEVLVWDNGSTDGTLEELAKWIPDRLPGKIFTGEPHGVGGSLKRLVEECQTEFCARIDADDINFPERLEKQVAFLQAHPEVAILGSQMKYIDGNGNIQKPLYHVPTSHDDIVHTLLKTNCIGHPSIMFRRSAILQIGNYREIPNVEDYDLWLRLVVRFQFSNLKEPLVYYRVHQDGTTQVAIREKRISVLTDNCFSDNALPLFGCLQNEAKLLRERKHPMAITVLWQIARHLQKTQGGSLLARLRSASFISSSKALINPDDILSRLSLLAINLDKPEFYQDLRDILRTIVLKIPLLQQAISKFKLKKWIKNHRKINTEIHSSIKILGIDPPFKLIDISPNCQFSQNLTIKFAEFQWWEEPKLTFQSGVRIGSNVLIAVKRSISIGKDTSIGSDCSITSHLQDEHISELATKVNALVDAPVEIGDGVTIANKVTIFAGVKIGKGAVIESESVVCENIPAYEVWAGVPAKFIKMRPQ
ncbi:glycosyltransferase [Pseudanabaena sp. FACHB-1277]|jgi:acetyltransferase-like isoleucine patch superfamily enzyme|uniref:Glycosyltransferase n=1 Tax=Pseudanabaena cinerea FACHB-1277 TaxID=2949581 RepID=A0A926Z5B7_9CYAN|nr:glycosyltransferase [Pseudanabaena cinerea]MBD2149418.1 glycosyltransferase [Pseudanabaena cinerea FACHB-1277]